MIKTLKVMDSSGDSAVTFDSEVSDHNQLTARKFFSELMAKGAAVFEIGRNGKGERRVKLFDELGQENVVVPRISGG